MILFPDRFFKNTVMSNKKKKKLFKRFLEIQKLLSSFVQNAHSHSVTKKLDTQSTLQNHPNRQQKNKY